MLIKQVSAYGTHAGTDGGTSAEIAGQGSDKTAGSRTHRAST